MMLLDWCAHTYATELCCHFKCASDLAELPDISRSAWMCFQRTSADEHFCTICVQYTDINAITACVQLSLTFSLHYVSARLFHAVINS